MEPTTPNDLAFFYLYDYTTPPRRRTHRRHASTTPTPLAHLETADTRRTLHIEAKRARLATHHENVKHVLAQYKLEDTVEKRLEILLDRMARADVNRDRLLKLTAENCGRKVEEAKIRARRVKKRRDEEARIARGGILERLESAEKRREELLSTRGRRTGSTSPPRRSDSSIRHDAAVIIQRAWRRRRVVLAVRDFLGQRISIESVTSHTFEQVVSKFKALGTVRATTRLLNVLDLVKPNVPEKDINSVVRTFLSAFMILGHTTEVLHSHEQPIEMDLIHKARVFVTTLESYLQTLKQDPTLPQLWESYLSAFDAWKSHDSTILVEMLVGKFVDLDLMLLDIQESEAMAAVVEEYSAGIKSGQMLLLSKIRRLIGEDTRATVRRAVQTGRRRRAVRLETHVETEPVEEVQTTMEIVEPPSSNLITNRRIMHELALNPEYEIPPPVKTDEEREREEAFKGTFYGALLGALRQNDQSILPTVVGDIKHRLLSLLQPSSPSYTTLSEQLDDTIVRQESQRGLFDLEKFVAFVLNTMRQLCAPVRDDDVAAIHLLNGSDTAETFVLRVRRIAEILALMALDSANFHLRIARPNLISQAIQYERTKFAEDLNSGKSTLDRTTTWIEEAGSKLSQEISQPSAIQIWRRAFVDLLFSSEELPETMYFDIDRLAEYRRRLHDINTLSALLLISKTFTAGNTSRPLDWKNLSHRLRVLQNDSAENIFAEIDRFIASPQIKRDLLLSMIRRIKTDARDPCVVLLERRVKTVLTTVMMGGDVGSLAGVGLGEVETELTAIANMIGMLAKVNWGCYREWYEIIAGKYIERDSLERNGE